MSEPKKYTDVNEFLMKHRTLDKEDFTHTALGTPPKSWPGKYNITDENSNLFYNLYQKYMFEGDGTLHITERHKEVSPILIDLDLRHNNNLNERQYNEEFIIKFLNIYISIIKHVIPSIDDDKLLAFVLEKDSPNFRTNSKGYFKDGIHIIFPNLVTEPRAQYLMRYMAIKNNSILDLFKSINVINNEDDIFDIAVIERNNWLMHGSSKPNHKAYKLSNIYKVKDDKMKQIVNNYSNKDLVKLLSIRHIKDCDIINNNMYVDTFEEEFGLIPKQQQIKKKKKVVNKKSKSPKKKNYLDDDEELLFVKSIIKILGAKRAEGYDVWIRLGWCLHNIDHRLLSDWVEFSKRSEKYLEGECEQEWNLMDNEGLGLGTLFLWAKEDNLSKFNEISRRNLRKCMLNSLSLEPNDIAIVVHNLYKNEFKCCSAKKNIWFQFKKHRWVEIDDAIELRKRLSKEVVEEYDRLDRYLGDKINDCVDDYDKDKLRSKKDTIGKIIKKLKNTGFKGMVVKECNELFHDHKFEERLDKNLNLIGFENGIYDLGQLEFRDGLPEDYLSFTTNINYYEHDDDDEDILAVKEFMTQVLPKKAVREYVWTLLGSFLWGKNLNEKFHIWTGCHAKDSKVLMYDGTIKMVQDVLVGDQLMGDDSECRNVVKLHTGVDTMYKLETSKGHNIEVNKDHILCLMATHIGSITLSKKENRYKCAWQEKDINGYPVNKCKNFPFKSHTKKIYRKNVKYYDNSESAFESANIYQRSLVNNTNYIKNGDIIEIPVCEYIKIMDKIGRRNYYLYSNKVQFEGNEVSFDPYMLGYWLGDGSSGASAITTMDKEVVDYFDKELDMSCNVIDKPNNKSKTYYYSNGHGKPNTFLKFLQSHNLIKNKHIPHNYKINDEHTRLQVLAGLIDSDGHYQPRSNQFEIVLKDETLVDDIVFLSRTLGFSARKVSTIKTCTNSKIPNKKGIYFRCIIYGDGIEKIPVLLKRKMASSRKINKNATKYGFSVSKIDDGKYYGFTVDNNHRYLTEDCVVHHNCGGNGKSKLIELFEYCFGDYCCKLPVKLLTESRGRAEGANPTLVRTKGKRFACLQEPDKYEEINVGLMKELTGGDTIIARALHKDPVEFKPQFKMVLTCNDLPKVSANDRGTWRRISVVEFISNFVEEPDPNEPYEFMIDEGLDEKLKIWPEAFMFLLLEYFKKYKKYGIKEPNEVKRNTEDYKVDSDMFVGFFSEKLIEVENPENGGIKLDDIYFVYQDWHKQAYGQNAKCPTRKDLKDNMVKKYGKKAATSSKNVWIGLGFKENNTSDILLEDGDE